MLAFKLCSSYPSLNIRRFQDFFRDLIFKGSGTDTWPYVNQLDKQLGGPDRSILKWRQVRKLRGKIRYAYYLEGARGGPLVWLCSTSRKVAGSIPDGVIRIFHWHNRFGRTMTLGSTEISTGVFPGG
jgi:hypothetical protein